MGKLANHFYAYIAPIITHVFYFQLWPCHVHTSLALFQSTYFLNILVTRRKC